MGNALNRATTSRINQQMLMQQGVQYTQDYFVYPVAIATTLASLATAPSVSLTIQADSHFEWIATSWFGYIDGAVTDAASSPNDFCPITLQITDGGSGRQLFNAPVPISSVAGKGSLLYYLPIPRIFLAKSQISFQATSIDPVNQWDNVYFNLIGRKVFESPVGAFR